MDLPLWSSRFPDPAVLRSEAMDMAEAFRQALLETVPAAEVRGLYLKGSALKLCACRNTAELRT